MWSNNCQTTANSSRDCSVKSRLAVNRNAGTPLFLSVELWEKRNVISWFLFAGVKKHREEWRKTSAGLSGSSLCLSSANGCFPRQTHDVTLGIKARLSMCLIHHRHMTSWDAQQQQFGVSHWRGPSFRPGLVLVPVWFSKAIIMSLKLSLINNRSFLSF